MRLQTFSEANFAKLSRGRVKDVSGCVLYYLHNGRNAWHSTWVQQYTEGCMHSSLQSAKDSAERQRTQGSVFYISALPAIVFNSASGSLAVTEINTNFPLAGYSIDAVHNDLSASTKRIKGARECYVKQGAPILGAALSFDYMSRFWNVRPPYRNGIILVASEAKSISFDRLDQNDLQLIRSYSNGGNYRLGWSKAGVASVGFANAVLAIAERFFEVEKPVIRDLADRQ